MFYTLKQQPASKLKKNDYGTSFTMLLTFDVLQNLILQLFVK